MTNCNQSANIILDNTSNTHSFFPCKKRIYIPISEDPQNLHYAEVLLDIEDMQGFIKRGKEKRGNFYLTLVILVLVLI